MNAEPEPAEILLVDRDAQDRRSMASLLEQAGHLVYAAGEREAAMQVARNQPLDLVICDLHLGGDGGLELWRELRRLPGMQDVPVMFLSSTQLTDIIRRDGEDGGAYCLRKPLDAGLLLDLIKKALWLPERAGPRMSAHARAQRPAPLLIGRGGPQAAAAASQAKAAFGTRQTAIRAAVLQGIRLPLA